MAKRNIAVIPARGGSKRIPKKNIIDFFDKPMIAWTIEAALESDIFDKILVSTDDPEIAEIAKRAGASVPFLREEFNDDVSPVSMATIAALKQLKASSDEEYHTVFQLMANCPHRNAADIRSAYDNYLAAAEKFQISCFKYGWMNPWWAAKLDNMGRPENLFPAAMTSRSQDLPETYCPTGAIWVADIASLYESGTFYGPGHIYHPLSWKAALDIDNYEDLEMAIALFHMSKREKI